MSIRDSLLRWVGDRAGVPEGCVMPRWFLVLACVLQPWRIGWWIYHKGYAIESDTYTIEGRKFSGRFLKELATLPVDKRWWFRIIRVENGFMTIERRLDLSENIVDPAGGEKMA